MNKEDKYKEDKEEDKFVKECMELEAQGRVANLNYMRKIIQKEYKEGNIDKNIYDKYMSLSSNKKEWTYKDWCLFVGK